MRAAVLVLLTVASSSAFGQITPEEDNVQGALGQLRQQKEIMLALDGIDRFGSHTSSLYSNAFFLWDPLDPTVPVKSEIDDYVNSGHTHRIVGDGTTLWSYSFLQNSYSAFRYGSYSGSLPKAYRSNMFQELTTASQSDTVFLARLLKETFSGDFAQYRTWFPGATITLVAKGGKVSSLMDPVDNNRVYVGDDLNTYLVYTYKSGLQRSGAFHLTRVDLTKPWTLSEVYYADYQVISPSTPRFKEWVITVYTGTLPASTNYVFVPPAGARAIANVKGGG